MKQIKFSILMLCFIFHIVFLAAMMLCFTACKNSENRQNAAQQQADQATPSDKKNGFEMPEIPDSLQQPKERAAYLVTHYWDNFDFTDTAYMHLPEVTEQAFANYIEVLSHTEKQTAETSIRTLLSKAGDEQTGLMYPYFCELFKKYLYEPNSPLRNDEFYIPVVRYIIEDRQAEMANKERAKFALVMMLKNRKGEIAADFSYTLSSDKTGSLYAINSQYTLLLFYNPDCHACEETIAAIKASPAVTRLIESKTLTICSFYPDADISIWKKHLGDIPTTWINGYDKQQVVQNKSLYDLKAIPSLYLLDKDKKVILKDTELPLIEAYLNE